MIESDIEYLSRRAAEELRLAEETQDPTAAGIHGRMALLYADRIAALSEQPAFDPIVQTRMGT